ncbi:hypothetical protein KBC59_00815 [Patescibacteria group bacterium]|jgi:hypothetical protein|nr:hypothetical protein [Patescibacteria group bacterium]
MVLRSRPQSRHSFAPPPSSSAYRNIALSFAGLALVVIIGALWVTSVYARVTVKVKRDSATLQTSIDIAQSPEQGQLRGRVVQGVFEKIQEFAVKDEPSSTPIVNTIVRGKVKIVNNYSKSQTLVKTTRLLTSDGRLYRIDQNVTVDPKESVVVDAYSDEAGANYVLSAGTKFTIPGLWIDLQKHIYAESTTGFSGGTEISKVVSSVDVTQAQSVLEEAVFEQAKKTLQSEAAVGDEWRVVYIKKVLEKKSNVNPGQQSDQFLASVKLDVTAVYYPQADMDALIRDRLKDKLPEGREFISFDPGAVVYKIESADPKLERAKIGASAQAATRLTANSGQLSKEAIAGLGLDEARTKLMAIEGVEEVDINIRPSWINRLPKSEDRIELKVE